jgi:general stress protein 26
MEKDTAARDKLWNMIKKYKFAMMTTQHEGDVLRSRPMTTIDREYDDSLWFFARADSTLAAALTRHPQVCLSYADSGAADFVCVAGAAEIVSDTAKKKALWNSMVQAWFPEGSESSYVVLIKVNADHAEFWDSTSSKLVQLFSVAKALATGHPPTELGDHQNVAMKPSGASARS